MTTGPIEAEEGEIVAGRYRILEELGRGASARVYRAEDRISGKDIALKLLSRRVTMRVGRERFLRELTIAANLSHAGIVPVLDCGRNDNELFLTMPVLSEGSLRDRLNETNRLSISESVSIAVQVAEALVYAHSKGFIHRDVKPENIMFAAGGPQLADFGVARALNIPPDQNLTLPGEAIGTPDYMSPEQSMGSGRLDERSDCYALGVVLWEMLAGQPPFRGRHPESIIVRKLDDVLPPLTDLVPGIADSVATLLGRVLEFSPRRRITMTDFAAELTGLRVGN